MSLEGARLRIVPTNRVLPHEIADPGREARIERRLQEDSLLRDPLMVGAVPDLDGYILLDGTNRQRALGTLGYPWVLVQILDYSDHQAIQLRTWCHAAHLALRDVLRNAETISGVQVEALPPLGAPDALAEASTLAVLLDRGERYVLRRSPAGMPRAAQLRQLVDIYEERLVREDCDPEDIEDHAKRLHDRTDHPAALLAFPPFSRSNVVAMAMRNEPIPAGITRHVVARGRALRVNLPLEVLSAATLNDANAALDAHLGHLQPRLYREPTILYDS